MNKNVAKSADPGSIEEMLSIELTTRCNMACSHCFARAGRSESSSLSFELVKKIIAEGYKSGYRHLHLTGGEPLIWKALFEALDYAYGLGFQTVFLNTNGTLLTADISRRLAAYNGISVSVSLEATEALHDRLRAGDSYWNAIQGIENALGAGIALSIFTTACRSLLSELLQFADNLFTHYPGIADLTLIQLIPATNGTFALSEELLAPEDFLQLLDMVSLLNLLGHSTCFLNNPLAYVASKLSGILWIPHSPPLFAEGRLIVMANRDICLSHCSKQSFGQYDCGMIKKVLDSERYRRAVSADEKTCPSCRYVELCAPNGMARPSEGYWHIASDKPYCQSVLDRVVH